MLVGNPLIIYDMRRAMAYVKGLTLPMECGNNINAYAIDGVELGSLQHPNLKISPKSPKGHERRP